MDGLQGFDVDRLDIEEDIRWDRAFDLTDLQLCRGQIFEWYWKDVGECFHQKLSDFDCYIFIHFAF